MGTPQSPFDRRSTPIGTAGLAAAHRPRQHGHDVRAFEASGDAGGRRRRDAGRSDRDVVSSNRRHRPERSTVGRRTCLAGLVAGGLAATGGCVGRTGSLVERDPSERISLSVKTLPADDDPYAIRIAQQVATHLRTVGIDATVVPMRDDELLHDLLVNHEFDIYVTKHPGWDDPDFLYPLLHSRFNVDPGWQNPFGFSDLSVDDRLTRQRMQSGSARRETLFELQSAIVRSQPLTAIAIPDRISAIREDRYRGWSEDGLASPFDYSMLRGTKGADREDRADDASNRSRPRRGELRVAYRDRRITRNLNPIAVEFRGRGTITGLLYDSLVGRRDDTAVPRLAESWERGGTETGGGQTMTVRLREGIRWHDGEPITADDVVFTYRFLADTTLDDGSTLPAPRFRARVSLVDAVDPVDERRVRMRFATDERRLALYALTVPVLPRHEWEPRTELTNLPGIDGGGAVPRARVWDNMNPVGSGPLRFERAVTDETLVLDRYDDHFTHRDGGSDSSAPDAGGIAFDRVSFRIVPSDAAAVELIAAGEVDATGTDVGAGAVPRIGRSPALRLRVSDSTAFYHLGFNTRRAPLSNPRFRRAVARLVDRDALVRDVFHGYATPATNPLADSEWSAPGLEWTGTDPVLPFIGTNNRLHAGRAREVFERAGYRYDGDGRLLRR